MVQQRPSLSSLISGLRDCKSSRDLEKVRSIRACAVEVGEESNIFLANTLVDAFGKCGSVDEAKRVFDGITQPTTVSWNALIFGYAGCGEAEMALEAFHGMLNQGCTTNTRTFLAGLKACTALAAREAGKFVDGKCLKVASQNKGRAIHAQAASRGVDLEPFVANALVDMYAKCGSMWDARKVFHGMKNPSVVSWTTLITGYADNGEARLALEAFSRMQVQGFSPNELTFVACLKACGMLVALETGRQIHASLRSRGLERDVLVGSSLVDFYGKCGSMDDAQEAFDSLPERDVVTWNALIAGYGHLRQTERVFHLFQAMQEAGVKPNGVTFLCILTACSHAGLVGRCRELFESMSSSKHGISPGIEHYVCMIDALGRSNQLEAAMAMVSSMPFKPDAATWRCLLGACRKWKNAVLGKVAFDSLLVIDKEDPNAYGLMANIFGSCSLWEKQAEVEAMRRNARAWRKLGQSWWSDGEGAVHSFAIGDRSHPQSKDIDAKLNALLDEMRSMDAYVPGFDSLVHNISEGSKLDLLCGHSEKLALACALINTPPGTTIRIAKNLRACNDCHSATAAISKIEQRTIICRDGSRFHVFKDGKCSCGDFW